MKWSALSHNFSLRVGVTLFIAIFTTLILLRLGITHQLLAEEHDEIKHIVQAHVNEIDAQIKRAGLYNAENVIPYMLDQAADKYLYIGLKRGKKMVGNLPAWPQKMKSGQWQDMNVDNKALLVTVRTYDGGTRLAVGYDLAPMQLVKTHLSRMVFNTSLMSAALAIAISICTTFLLNQSLRRFNRSFQSIMRGNLGQRIRVYHSNDQIDVLAQNLNAMLDWLQALLQTAQETSNHIAHDLRTPLSRLQIRLRNWLATPDLDKPWPKEFANALRETERMQALFAQILTLSSAEGQQARANFGPVVLQDILDDIADLYEVVLEQKHQHLVVENLATGLVFFAHEQLLKQSLSNLIENAHKFSPDDSTIKLSLVQDGNHLIVSVRDEGPGIAEEQLALATQRFFRADAARNSQNASQGFGLGLSLVDAVVRLHHGTLTLENMHPGLAVTLHLPIKN